MASAGTVNPGVVGMAEVIQPNSSNTGGAPMRGTPVMWSLVWVGAAALFLVMIHLAMIGRAAR